MGYLDEVLMASGGYGAPAENLKKDKKKAPKGYHYMPDGQLMKDSEHEALSLGKDSDDPCWSGYVQLGTKKGKNGKEVPNCVPIDQAAEGETTIASGKPVSSTVFTQEVLDHLNHRLTVSGSTASLTSVKALYRSHALKHPALIAGGIVDAAMNKVNEFLLNN